MNIFSVDKLVFKAIGAYRSGEYQIADTFLNSALELDHTNFAANIWKVRTLVMLGGYVEAIDIIDTYSKKKLHTKLSEMFSKWKEFCLTKVELNVSESKDGIQIEKETDELLKQYEHQRDFTLWNVIVAILMFFAIAFWIVKLRIFPEERNSLIILPYTLIIGYYYYSKAILPMNVYDLRSYIFQKITQLYHSYLFKKVVVQLFALHVIFTIFRPAGSHTGATMIVIASITIVPLLQEILLRGFLYGYLKKYNEWIAWIIVTIAFCVTEGQAAYWWYIILSAACFFVYHHEATILAPIALHMLNNIFSEGLYILVEMFR